MNVMKTSLTIIPMCPQKRFYLYKNLSRLVLCYKRIGLPCCTLLTITITCPLQITFVSNYSLPTISVLADKTLLKTDCHFLLLLIGFDTLTYRKDLQLIPYTCGSSRLFSALLPGSEAPLVRKLGKDKFI